MTLVQIVQYVPASANTSWPSTKRSASCMRNRVSQPRQTGKHTGCPPSPLQSCTRLCVEAVDNCAEQGGARCRAAALRSLPSTSGSTMMGSHQKWHSTVQYTLRRSVCMRRSGTWSVPAWFSAGSDTSADERPDTLVPVHLDEWSSESCPKSLETAN